VDRPGKDALNEEYFGKEEVGQVGEQIDNADQCPKLPGFGLQPEVEGQRGHQVAPGHSDTQVAKGFAVHVVRLREITLIRLEVESVNARQNEVSGSSSISNCSFQSAGNFYLMNRRNMDL